MEGELAKQTELWNGNPIHLIMSRFGPDEVTAISRSCGF